MAAVLCAEAGLGQTTPKVSFFRPSERMYEPERLERTLRVTTPEEADLEDARFWAAADPAFKLECVERLRNVWMKEDERRLKRVLEVVTF